MRKIFYILLLSLLSAVSYAQSDSLSGLRLFKKAATETSGGISDALRLSGAVSTNDTKEKLRTLENLYSAGKYSEALQLACQIHSQNRLDKPQSLFCLKYGIAAFKELDFHREADSVARVFLQKDPFYNISDSDPQPFCEVLKNYYTMPEFSVWIAVGMTSVKPILDTVRTIIDTVEKKPEYEIIGNSVQIGLEYRPLKYFSVFTAPTLSSYSLERTFKRTKDVVYRYKEKSRILSLPLCIEAGLYRGHEFFVPSVYAGMSARYVWSARYTAYTDAVGVYRDDDQYRDAAGMKNRFNCSAVGGIRLNFNVRRIVFFADFGLSFDILPYNNPAKIYSDSRLVYQDLSVPDVYRMAESQFRLGVKVNLNYMTIAKYKYGY